MINKGVLFSFFFLVFFSCKKEANNISSPTPVPLPAKDTLSAGWSIIDLNNSDLFWIDIMFENLTTGYAIGGTTVNSVLYKTQDGGNTWSEIPPARMRKAIAHFSNLALTRNKVFITTSTNKLYSVLNDSSLDSTTFPSPPADLQFINVDTGYLVTGNSLYRSINSGTSWDRVFSANSSKLFSALCFKNTGKSWLGIGNNLYSSKGNIIDYFEVPFVGNYNWHSMSSPSDRLVFFTTNAGLYKFTDLTATIETIGLPFPLNNYIDIHFETELIGYLTTGNRIMKTTDGGKSWKIEVALLNNVSIVEIDAKGGVIWACCSNGKILRYKP